MLSLGARCGGSLRGWVPCVCRSCVRGFVVAGGVLRGLGATQARCYAFRLLLGPGAARAGCYAGRVLRRSICCVMHLYEALSAAVWVTLLPFCCVMPRYGGHFA